RGPDQFSSTALAINADALPAPTTIVRPFGGEGRWAGTRSDGDAAFTAASNIALSNLRGSIDMRLSLCCTPNKVLRVTEPLPLGSSACRSKILRHCRQVGQRAIEQLHDWPRQRAV